MQLETHKSQLPLSFLGAMSPMDSAKGLHRLISLETSPLLGGTVI
jgi:hypothetical protein